MIHTLATSETTITATITPSKTDDCATFKIFGPKRIASNPSALKRTNRNTATMASNLARGYFSAAATRTTGENGIPGGAAEATANATPDLACTRP